MYFFMLDALPVTTLPISGIGTGAEYAGVNIVRLGCITLMPNM